MMITSEVVNMVKRRRGRPRIDDSMRKQRSDERRKRYNLTRRRLTIYVSDDVNVEWEKLKKERNFTSNSVALKFLLDVYNEKKVTDPDVGSHIPLPRQLIRNMTFLSPQLEDVSTTSQVILRPPGLTPAQSLKSNMTFLSPELEDVSTTSQVILRPQGLTPAHGLNSNMTFLSPQLEDVSTTSQVILRPPGLTPAQSLNRYSTEFEIGITMKQYKQFTCKYCGKFEHSFGRLMHHVRRHTRRYSDCRAGQGSNFLVKENAYQRKHCMAYLPVGFDLARNARRIKPAKYLKNSKENFTQCDSCQKLITGRTDLQRYHQSRMKENPLQCKCCKKCFEHRSAEKVVKVITPELAQKCPMIVLS